MRAFNLVLAFLLELVMLAAWAWAGWKALLPPPWPGLLAVLLPLFVIAVWGLVAAPRARFPLTVPATVAVKAALLFGGAAALALVGEPVLACLNAVVVAINVGLGLRWNQFDRTPSGPLHANLAALLDDYGQRYPNEASTAQFREFLRSGEPLQGKVNPRRHITASAWLVNPQRTKALLTHHAKLDIWVQLGGHTDEGEDWAAAALREATEESGLSQLSLVSPQLFDLDIHTIPARGSTPAHEHYDLRFLVEADDAAPLVLSDESHALAWVELAQLEEYTTEESQFRMRKKTTLS